MTDKVPHFSRADTARLYDFVEQLRDIENTYRAFEKNLDNLFLDVRTHDIQRALLDGFVTENDLPMLKSREVLRAAASNNLTEWFEGFMGQLHRGGGEQIPWLRGAADTFDRIAESRDIEKLNAFRAAGGTDSYWIECLQDAMTEDFTDTLQLHEGTTMRMFPDSAYITDLEDLETVQQVVKGRLNQELSERVRNVFNPETLSPENAAHAVNALFPEDIPTERIERIKNALGGDEALAWQYLQRQVVKGLWEKDTDLRGREGRSVESPADPLLSKTVKNPVETTSYSTEQLKALLREDYFRNLENMNQNVESF